MLKQRIEVIARDAIERALRGAQSEDSFVEFKSAWVSDHAKAARQIAALCNAARGSEAMWIIGVDEKGLVALGSRSEELANWWPAVESHFDGASPILTTLVIKLDQGVDVTVLNFETVEAPYVFLTKKEPYTREIPWRSGERTRSAKRSEVLQLLIAQSALPGWEFVHAEVTLRYIGSSGSTGFGELRLRGSLFIEVDEPVSAPGYRWKSQISVRSDGEERTVQAQLNLSQGIGRHYGGGPSAVEFADGVMRIAKSARVSAGSKVSLDEDTYQIFKSAKAVEWVMTLGLNVGGDVIHPRVTLIAGGAQTQFNQQNNIEVVWRYNPEFDG